MRIWIELLLFLAICHCACSYAAPFPQGKNGKISRLSEGIDHWKYCHFSVKIRDFLYDRFNDSISL